MTAAAAPVRFRAARLEAALSRDALAFGGLTLLVALMTALAWGTWGDNH